MATGYWHNATSPGTGLWSSTAQWYTTLAGTTAVATVPGAADVAYFNANTFTSAYDVFLNGARSVGSIVFNSNSGGITLKGGTSSVPATQTLTLGSSGINISAATAANSNLTLNNTVNIALTSSGTPFVVSGGTSRSISVAGIISGVNFGIAKTSGDGVLQLSGNNSYSGNTTIGTGVVRVANNSAFGTGTVFITGGTLSSASGASYSLSNGFNLNGTMTFGDSINNGGLSTNGSVNIAGTTNLTVSGSTLIAFSGSLIGSGNLTALGGFGLFFTGQTGNTWSGALTVNGASVYAGNANSGVCTQFDASNATITLTSGQLFFLGLTAATNTKNYTGGGTLAIANSGGVTFNTGTMTGLTGTVQTFSDTTTSASSLARFANWPTAAGSVNNYSASTASGTHTLEYNGSANVGPLSQNWNRYATAGAQTMTFRHYGTSGATFSLSGSVTHQSATNTIGLRFDVNNTAGLLTLSGNITQASTGVFNVTKLGVGAATLSGNNSFTGTFAVSAGTLNANLATALGADTSSGSVTSGATLSLGAALNYSTRNFTISGTGVSTGGALVHAFAGTAKIGVITLGAATYVRGTASGTSTLSSSIANGGFSLTAGAASANTLTFTGGISGAGGLVVGNSASDTGTVALTTTNTYQGSTTLTYGTTQAGNVQAFGTVGTVTLGASGTLQTLTTGGQNGKLTVAGLTNSAGGVLKIGGA